MHLRTALLALPLFLACRTAPPPAADAAASADEISRSTDEEVPEFEVIPLKFAEAPALQESLEGLVASASEGGEREIKILTDPRTNSLLVMAPPEQMVELKKLIALLDVEATTDS